MKLHKNKRLLSLLALGLIAATSFVSMASEGRAQAVGSTDVDITLPDIVILHYFGSVSVELTAANMATFLGYGGNAVQETVSVSPLQGFDVDLAMSPSSPSGSLSAAVLILRNAWAVRSLSLGPGGNSATTQLDITIDTDTLEHASLNANTIVLDAATVNVTGGGSGASSITFDSPGLFSPQLGDVQLTLDMTNAGAAGNYAGGVFTLEATNP